MHEKSRKKREAPISYRPPADLRELFFELVAKSGLTISGFITRRVFGDAAPIGTRRPPIELKYLAKILANSIRTYSLVQKALSSGGERQIALLEEAVAVLRDIRTALFELMGKKP
ncbi:MAG: hypothetical protein H6954_05305 [Chromatiaceae bacterium]|nr:hypothetical protein [Chromatiaceae bacterium]